MNKIHNSKFINAIDDITDIDIARNKFRELQGKRKAPIKPKSTPYLAILLTSIALLLLTLYLIY